MRTARLLTDGGFRHGTPFIEPASRNPLHGTPFMAPHFYGTQSLFMAPPTPPFIHPPAKYGTPTKDGTP